MKNILFLFIILSVSACKKDCNSTKGTVKFTFSIPVTGYINEVDFNNNRRVISNHPISGYVSDFSIDVESSDTIERFFECRITLQGETRESILRPQAFVQPCKTTIKPVF